MPAQVITPFIVQVGRHGGLEITLQAPAVTAKDACDIALALAQDQWTNWRTMRPYGPLFVEAISDASTPEDLEHLPVPPGYGAPAAGLVHPEINAVIAALRFLASNLDEPAARPFDHLLNDNGTVEPLNAEALEALADRFVD